MKYVKRTKRQKLTRVESVVRGLYNIPQVNIRIGTEEGVHCSQ